jgi:hypothetical protein
MHLDRHRDERFPHLEIEIEGLYGDESLMEAAAKWNSAVKILMEPLGLVPE